jgi:serralysin
MSTLSQITARPESGVAHIDALIGTAHPWNYIGRTVLYYSFSITSGVESSSADVKLSTRSAFTESQKAHTRAMLDYVSSVTGLRFAEIADGALADIHFANADLVHPYTAALCVNGYKYNYGVTGQVTSLKVDSWVYLDTHEWAHENLALTPGGWGYETLLHEFGHALGLKHPFDGEDVLSPGADHTGNTVMSYTSSGAPRSTYGPYDMAALDWLYGRDGLGGSWGIGTSGRYLTGTAASETLVGGATDDRMEGGGGNDLLDGGAGYDLAVYTGVRARYDVSKAGGTVWVRDGTGAEGRDSVINIERLQFADMSVNLEVGDLAKTIPRAQLDSLVELYIALLDRVPDADGMAHWIGQFKGGQSLEEITASFYSSAVVFGDLTGYGAGLSHQEFVGTVYRNALGRDSVDSDGLAFWTDALASGAHSRASLVAAVLGSAHTFKGDATWGWVADLLDNKLEVGRDFAIHSGLSYNGAEANIVRGMAIIDAITPTSTAYALSLIGVNDGLDLLA